MNLYALLSSSSLLVSVGLVLTLPLSTPGFAQEGAPDAYRVLERLELGGEGGWDYLAVEPGGHRLFLSRSTHVMVLDLETRKIVGDIPDTEGVHGIAFAPEFGRGFTSNGRAGTATIFDLKTLAALGTVKTGENPDAILYDAHTQRVFTFNARSGDTTAIDAATGTVAGTLALGGKPEAAVADGEGRIFVNLEDKSEVAVFDAGKLKVLARWPLAPGEEPSGLALDAKQKRLFSVCGNKTMVVLDSESGHVIASEAIGAGVDGAAFDPATGCAFSSNGDGTLTIVHEDGASKFTVLQNVETARGARTVALDPVTHRIYLSSARYEPQPEAKPGERQGRPKMIPDSFTVIVVGR